MGTLPTACEALAGAEAAMDALQAALTAGLWRLSDADVVALQRRVNRLGARQASVQLTAVRELDTRGVAAATGMTTRAFLASSPTITPAAAGEQVRMSEALSTRFGATGAALAAGAIGYEQAKAIVDTVNQLPKVATAEQKTEIEEFLLAQTGVFNATDLRLLGKKLDEVIDPDGTPDRDEAAESRRGASIRNHHNGSQTLRWTDTDERIALAKAAIEALNTPLPGPDGERDPRSLPVRTADALTELCRRALREGKLPTRHGIRPHLTVVFPESALREEHARTARTAGTAGAAGAAGPGPFGRTATGEDLSPTAIARLLCDASLTALIVDHEGVPLQMGRTRRTVTTAQWNALVVRDVGCQYPACRRPAADCEAHHCPPWSQDGRTDLDSLGLYCTGHHHFLHEGGWTARIGPDGRPEVIPPHWIGPDQKPRRNLYWRLQHELKLFRDTPDPDTPDPPDPPDPPS